MCEMKYNYRNLNGNRFLLEIKDDPGKFVRITLKTDQQKTFLKEILKILLMTLLVGCLHKYGILCLNIPLIIIVVIWLISLNFVKEGTRKLYLVFINNNLIIISETLLLVPQICCQINIKHYFGCNTTYIPWENFKHVFINEVISKVICSTIIKNISIVDKNLMVFMTLQ